MSGPMTGVARRVWTAAAVLVAVLLPAVAGPAAARGQAVADRSAPPAVARRPVAGPAAAPLAATVTIRRDAYGVPHVSAPTDAGCVFGFLYCQAEDYFWQIEDSYIRSIGRAAEVYGEAELPSDLLNRALEIPRLSREEYAAATPAGRALFDAAAEGLNWFLDTHPEVRPRLITRFEGWHVPAFRRFMLYQSFIYRKSGLSPREILTAATEVRGDGDAAVGLGAAALGRLAAAEAAAAEHDLLADHVGSNMWAVSPAKSASGKALMFINPHQPFFGPGQWYEGHLTSGEGWNLLGACFFGSPFPTLGHNERLAWSHTVNEPDVADVWEIALDPADPLRYRHGDGHRPVTAWTDTIGVAADGAVAERRFRFRKTHHGPIVAVRKEKPLAVRLAKFEEGGGLEQWQAMGKARSVAEFKAALTACDIPMFNCLVADADGAILFVYNGAIPRRDPAFDWTKPVDGADPRTDWQGYHALDDLPQLADPACGFLQNCNQGPLTTVPHGKELAAGEADENPPAARFPKYMIGERERDNGRARISRRILRDTERFDFDAWTEAGFDTRVIEAEARVPELVAEFEAVQKADPARGAKLEPVVAALRNWDCVSTVESVPMTLFVLTFDRVMQMVQTMDLLNSPRLRALEATIADLEGQFGTWQVPWGEINRLQRIHGSEIDMEGRGAFSDEEPSLPVAGSPGPVGIVFNFYARPQPGQKRRYGVAGHSYVGVVELGEQIRARTVLQFGQSGDPASPHWFDQAPLYAAGKFKPSLFTAAEIAAHAGPAYHPGEPRPAPPKPAGAPADAPANAPAGGRVYVVPPGPGAQALLQERFVDATPGDVIQLEEGVYRLTHQLDLAASSITLRGRGSARTVLSFAGQSGGSHGIEATGDNLVFEQFAVEDTAGDAVKILGSRNVVLRDVRAEWTGEPSAANGAYGIYPVQCENVLMEGCTARGASDAGLYVGQCRGVIVRGCLAERNVAGIEIENTLSADVHDNLARDNAGGILVFDLPGLPVKNGGGVRVFRNRATANNHRNFADPGSMVASVPPGTGVMILATDRVEISDNDLVGNDSASVLVLSYLALGKKYDDAAYDPVPEEIAIHGNRISGGGGKPQGELATLLMPLLGRTLPDILWDGVTPAGSGKPRLRVAANGAATYANFRVAEINPLSLITGAAKPKTDPAELAADVAALSAVALQPFHAPSTEIPPAVRFYRSLPTALSALGLFDGRPALQEPVPGVVRYELATELFSDHSRKRRFIRLPAGGTIGYRDEGVVEFPVGTLIAKTFSFPGAAADGGERLVETRIEMRTADGWFGASYLWNDAQDDAVLCLGGRQVEIARGAGDETVATLHYEVPGANQCLSCHAQVRDGGRPAYEPLGPTAANMNRPAPDDPAANQLARLAEAGLLAGLPAAGSAPAVPAAFDPHAGSVAERARGWLEVNCAHCHNPAGSARTTGLDLRRGQGNPARVGVWKSPVAAGRGAGGRAYDIVPGKPDESIIVHRLETDEPAVMMPSLGRKLVHADAVALVREWIEQLPAEK